MRIPIKVNHIFGSGSSQLYCKKNFLSIVERLKKLESIIKVEGNGFQEESYVDLPLEGEPFTKSFHFPGGNSIKISEDPEWVMIDRA